MACSNTIVVYYDLLDQLCQSMCGKNFKHKLLENIMDYMLEANEKVGRVYDFDDSFLISQVSRTLRSNKQSLMPQYLELHNRLKTCTTLTERSAILTFLLTYLDFKQVTLPHDSNPLHSTMMTELLRLKHDVARCRQVVDGIMHDNQESKEEEIKPAHQLRLLHFEGLPPNSSSEESTSVPTTQNVSLEQQLQELPEGVREIRLMENLVQNVIYSFIGIQGEYLKKDVVTGEFRLSPAAQNITISQGGMMLRLAELGTLYDQVQIFASSESGRCALGLMGQTLIGLLHKEINWYLGMVAVLQDQFTISAVESLTRPEKKMTLIRLQLWSYLPRQRLEWVVRIGEACEEKKGGALASIIYSFLDNGDPLVRDLTHDFLVAVCRPIVTMIWRWILDGELIDPYGEFFIECLSEISPDRLWHEMYRVRTSMLPSFISSSLSRKILVTGKSINFLREICKDSIPIKNRDQVKTCLRNNVASVFAKVPDTELHSMIEEVYLQTSTRVLDIMKGPHKLLEHFVAMKRFLLLGQGEFVSTLLEQLKPELDRPAKELFRCDLSSILDSAIRVSNVKYMDQEIINRLDIRLLTPHEGDTGWDIFTLHYSVRGPLQTILEKSMHNYKIIFKPLWQMKHITQLLSSKIWKDQMSASKHLRPMYVDISSIMYLLNLHTSEMIHFTQEMQYYILFEVIECAWIDFEKKAQSAKTLDEILRAHDELLDIIKIGAFLDSDSDIIREHLEDVYQCISQLENWQNKFFDECYKDFEDGKTADREIQILESEEKWLQSSKVFLARADRKDLFNLSVHIQHRTLEKIGNDFEAVVGRFLLALHTNIDPNLQLLAIRLDFNEYYKQRDQRLDVPLTFEHLRNKSIMNNSRTNAN